VIYVHGGTFGADLSIFYKIDDAIPQLHRVVRAARELNGGRPVRLIAHSWGGAVAARYAGLFRDEIQALVLFAPISTRHLPFATPPTASQSSHYAISIWAQYRRFIEDVPRGQAQVLDEAHFQMWSQDYLATDADANSRIPPSVMTPYGPIADIGKAWSGKPLYDASLIAAPTLLIRGAWDSACSDEDARLIMDALSSTQKIYSIIDCATHLTHLEKQRDVLYKQVNEFFQTAT